MPPTLFSKTILLALIVVSASLFSKRLAFVLSRIRQAKPEPGSKFSPLPQRIWRFFWEVACQAKVIRERPLPGLAHAFVFWAFCATALVILDDVAGGFGLSFLNRESGLGAFCFWLAFLFAACCTVAIAALAFRRFVLRPEWLEPLSYQAGLIAALIFVLMLAHLPEWWEPQSSPAGQALWWVRTCALLSLLPLIPRTRHLHILLSPWAVFLRRSSFSQIPPLTANDEGMVSGKDITRLTALQAYSCLECGRCTEHCPAYNTGKDLDPRLIALGLSYYLDEYGPHNAMPILANAVSESALFECTTCGACEYQCPAGIQHLPMIVGLRRGAVNTGAWEDENGAKLFLNLERHGNAMGLPEAERERFIQRQQFPIFDGTQEYCLWLGCMGVYDLHGREIITSFAAIMQHLGTSFGVLRKERCTGDPARRLGNDVVFAQLAGANLGLLRAAGVQKIVSICPHCVRTMAEDWNQLGDDLSAGDNPTLEARIEHHSEFLARHAHLLPETKNGQSVVFHDPCYLGRYRGIYDEPRRVIGRSAKVVEAPRSREHSFCCGAGGGLVFLGEEGGDRINEVRAAELAATGADTIGTACPFCQSVFRDALDAMPENTPRLLDIAQITAAQIARG